MSYINNNLYRLCNLRACSCLQE